MSTTANKTLTEAANWIGYQESPYSEETPFGPTFGWYNDYEWCGIFCQYCIQETGGNVGTGPNDTIPFTHYTPTGVLAFQELGRWDTTPQVGDLVYFDWGYGGLGANAWVVDHVGLVENVDNWPNSIRTIEGNINEAVGRFVRYNNGSIVGFGRPLYTSAPQLTEPFFEYANAQTLAYHWLRQQGLSDAGAAGIMGNMQQESTFRFDIVEGMGTDISVIDDVKYSGIGILQWSFSRRLALLLFATNKGKPWQDGETQLEFLLKEINESTRYVDMWNQLKSATDPVAAARLFDDVFVRSGTKGSRFDYASDFFDRIKAGEFGSFVQVNTTKVAHYAVPAFI